MDDEKPLKQDFGDALKMLQENNDVLEKLIREQARLIRISYQALTAEGFNDGQAMEIIKARGFLA